MPSVEGEKAAESDGDESVECRGRSPLLLFFRDVVRMMSRLEFVDLRQENDRGGGVATVVTCCCVFFTLASRTLCPGRLLR